jgi:hypothetical protein
MLEVDWLRPTPSNLWDIAVQYADISGLPALNGTNTQNNNFLSPCWNWTEDHVRALRVIVMRPHPFHIDAWMALDLDVEVAMTHDEISNQFAAPSLNNQFSVLISMLEQVEDEWDSTYTSEDQDLAPVNRRIAGSEILSMILRILLFSASKTLGGTGYHLQLYACIFFRRPSVTDSASVLP